MMSPRERCIAAINLEEIRPHLREMLVRINEPWDNGPALEVDGIAPSSPQSLDFRILPHFPKSSIFDGRGLGGWLFRVHCNDIPTKEDETRNSMG
jgi:hypothetical protein